MYRWTVFPDIHGLVMFAGGYYDSHESVDDIMKRPIVPALAGV